jgi:uncharacterized protein involved in exopolysaccharide biosynthesis
MELKLEVNDLKNLFRRRKKIFIIPLLLIFVTALAVSFALPAVYQSEATILVEGQKISEDYVSTTATSFVEERIQTITRQIMSRANLMQIIDQFDLYRQMRNKASDLDLVDKLKEDIVLETIDTDVYNRKSGRQIVTIIAFTLSYQGHDPAVVQKVTNNLASLYVEKDLKERESSAVSTTEFFQMEIEELKQKIERYEEEISKFKRAHFDELPEYSAINIQAEAELEKEYDRILIQLRALQSKKTNLEGRLAGVNPSTMTVVDEDNVLLNPKDRLKQLRVQLMDLQANLSDKHPDVKRLKRAIKDLEAEDNNVNDKALKRQRLMKIDGQLAVLRETLGPNHPDLLKLSREARQLEQELEMEELHPTSSPGREEKPDNPAYLNLQALIIAVETEMQALREEQQKIKKEIEAYRQKISNAPLVEKELSELTRDYESARQRYREISENLMRAKFARGMDESQRSTRFRILEPAYFPQKPIKPNRLAIAFMGFFVAISCGFVLAVFKEYADNSIKTRDELDSLTDIPVFAVIPFVEHRSTSSARKVIWSFATILILLTSLWLIHLYVSPIDSLITEYGSRVIERFR